MTQKINFKRLFWLFQFCGWGLFILYDLLTSLENITPDKYKFWILSYFYGFSLSIILRFTYLRFFKNNQYIYHLLIISFFGSLFGGTLWFFLNQASYLISVRNHADFEEIFSYVLWNETINHIALRRIASQAIPLIGWSFLYFGVKFWLELVKQKETNQKNLNLLQEAKLKLLSSQMNPHFLFNSLNTIEGLVDENKTTAKEVIAKLSEYLRFSLKSQQTNFIPLGVEIDAIRNYLGIMKIRFENKIHYNFILDKDIEEISIPSFTLQPIVENAVKYGMKTSPKPLKIIIKVKKLNEDLHLNVCNTGKWLIENSQESSGIGIKNLRERLDNLFPEKHQFKIEKTDTFVNVSITLNTKFDNGTNIQCSNS